MSEEELSGGKDRWWEKQSVIASSGSQSERKK